MSPREAEPNGDDHGEQAVGGYGGAKQLRVLGSAAPPGFTVGPYDSERRNVSDERSQLESAAVHICGERAADAQFVGACLLLDECPPLLRVLLAVYEIPVQLGPLNSGFDFDFSFYSIELHDASEGAHVDESGPFAELLATHCVPSPGDAERSHVGSGGTDRGLHGAGRLRSQDRANTRWVEVRVNVVDADSVGVGAS